MSEKRGAPERTKYAVGNQILWGGAPSDDTYFSLAEHQCCTAVESIKWSTSKALENAHVFLDGAPLFSIKKVESTKIVVYMNSEEATFHLDTDNAWMSALVGNDSYWFDRNKNTFFTDDYQELEIDRQRNRGDTIVFAPCPPLDVLAHVDVRDSVNPGMFALSPYVLSVVCRDLTLNDSAFMHCQNLSDVDLRGVKSIGNYAFAGCTGLRVVDMAGHTEIPRGCFLKCSALERVDWDQTLEKVGEYAFEHCSELQFVGKACTELTIPVSAFKGTPLDGYNDRKATFRAAFDKYVGSSDIPPKYTHTNLAAEFIGVQSA